MSGLLLLRLLLGVTWAVLPPQGAERVTDVSGEHAAAPVLWVYLVRRSAPRRWRLAAVPGVLALHVLAGLALAVAIVVRTADLAVEWCARRADLWIDPDS